MFGWVRDIVSGFSKAISEALVETGNKITGTIWLKMIEWFYDTVYEAVGNFFSMMGNMGAQVFDLQWIQATVRLFSMLAWALFIAGTIVAVFDLAIEYQNGRGNVRNTLLNILKGFFACSLIGILPIELYKFCISLQNTFVNDLSGYTAEIQVLNFAEQCKDILKYTFAPTNARGGLLGLLMLIAYAYCVIKIFFQNIKRGGILLVQISVGSLYMFSVPRGYTDGFVQWIKQVVALCLTAFMQTSLLYLGLITFPTSVLLGFGIMLAAGEVPRIAQQFGLDSSVRFNAMGAIHTTAMAVNLTRSIARAGK